MTFKEKVYKSYREIIETKIQLFQNTLKELRESGSNETKSTAGDKYETALAMLHIEQENVSRQLSEILKQKALFSKIDPAVSALKNYQWKSDQNKQRLFFHECGVG